MLQNAIFIVYSLTSHLFYGIDASDLFYFLISFFFTYHRLGIPDLGIDEKYQRILQNYGRDIEMVSRIYIKQKLDPPIGRDLPPVSGRIMWARQLYSRIQGPMDLFQQVALNFPLSTLT